MDILVCRKYKELVWINKKPRLINLMGRKTSIDTSKNRGYTNSQWTQLSNKHEKLNNLVITEMQIKMTLKH